MNLKQISYSEIIAYLYHFADEIQTPWSNKRSGKQITNNNLAYVAIKKVRSQDNAFEHLNKEWISRQQLSNEGKRP